MKNKLREAIQKAWPADKVQRWSTAKLVPYARNARLHTEEDVGVIAQSITRWGFTNPVLVDEAGSIIAGHGRVLAAKQLGLETLPVMVATGWSQAEKAAYCVADNQIAARATWDFDLLRSEIATLKNVGFDIGELGFDPTALAELMAPATLARTDPEIAPEAPETPVSRLGDCWLLGRHRVACGDSTNVLDVALAMGSLRPSLMVTDPPYGVSYDPSWRGKATGGPLRATGKVLNDDRADWREAWALFPGDVAYIWHAGLFGGVVAESLAAAGFDLRSQIIWAKSHFALGRGDYHWHHEACFYVIRKGAKSAWNSDRKQSTLWQIAGNDATNPTRETATGHGTQKPLECMRRPIEHNSRAGDVIYDPFLGSGSTLIAAELTGRICVGLELSPAYVDVIVRRWQDVTGNNALLQTSGETFAQTTVARTSVEPEDVA